MAAETLGWTVPRLQKARRHLVEKGHLRLQIIHETRQSAADVIKAALLVPPRGQRRIDYLPTNANAHSLSSYGSRDRA
jgi:hypothetical protein